MNVSLTCIVEDGSEPTDGTLARVAFRQDVAWPVGYAGTISAVVKRADGSPLDLTGCSMALVVREHGSDVIPILQKTATIEPIPVVDGGGASSSGDVVVDGGNALGVSPVVFTGDVAMDTGVFTIPNTTPFVAGVTYFYDVRLTTAGSAVWQVIPASKFTPTLAITKRWEPSA